MADPENIKAIIRLRPALQIVQPLDSSASSPHYIPRQTCLFKQSPTDYNHPPYTCPYTLQPENASIYAGGSWFTFDGVHSPSSSTGQIYQTHIASMIEDAVKGYNSTLFAYGATGSGKSFSMMGTEKEDGIMERAIRDVFDLIEQDQEREYVVRVSYLEIYNEQLRDLLSTDRLTSQSSNHNLPKIHEDRQGRIFVRPLVSTPCGDPEDVMRLLLEGESRRRTERTEWNLHSSRSHSIFSLTLESRPVIGPAGFPITSSTMRQVTRQNSRTQLRSEIPSFDHPSLSPDPAPASPEVFLGTGISKMPITPSVTRFKSSTASSKSSIHVTDGSIRISQLNLVDLAGSEKLTDNEARNKEASYIKKSLLALQSVVSSLTELGTSTSSSNQSNHRHRLMHIPYRNSQLTRLLQTSLSGNAKVAFLCTISPDPECEIETLSTLRFAAGAKKVETKAELGQVVDRATLLEALEAKVLELEAALMTNADYTEALERERDEAIERADGAEKICDDYESKLAELQTLRTPLKEQHDHLKRLILTGSPRSSYATQNTLENHNLSSLGMTATLNRKKSTNKRLSRFSETAAPLCSPTKKVGWKELFFDDAGENKQHEPKHSHDVQENDSEDAGGLDRSEKINELNLTIAKLEATLAEAEETHAGEILELKEEISQLENQVQELQVALQERESQETSLNPSINKSALELKAQDDRIIELQVKLSESETARERLKLNFEEERVEHEKQLALQSHLIATLEQKLRSSSSASRPLSGAIEEEKIENGVRRYSELTANGDVTVNGDIDKEDEGVSRGAVKTNQAPSLTSKTKKVVVRATRSKSRSTKNNGSRWDSANDQNIQVHDLDVQSKEDGAELVRFTQNGSETNDTVSGSNDLVKDMNGNGGVPSRKRTTSQRTNLNVQADPSLGSESEDLKASSESQEPQTVRRSARHRSTNKKVLGVVEN